MLASQLIYTACGKDRSGAFSVWSKSADITKSESDEITKLMGYRRPAHLPYEPSEEELRMLFPKKFGFFVLSSGRYCIAQSSFIGRVYSDMDPRTGNFLLHAFVLDSLEGILPMAYAGSDIFLTKLTYEQWHEQDAPEELPKVEFAEMPANLGKAEIDSFFDPRRSRQFAYLLQAVINSVYSDGRVTFCDTDAHLWIWYKALSLCIPQCMQEKITFCSFYTPTVSTYSQMDAHNPGDVMLRNVSPDISSSVYSYSQDISMGGYGFNFQGDQINDSIPLSRYVNAVVRLMGDNPFQSLMMVDAINGIMETHGCALDEAADLYHLQKHRFEWFADLAEIVQVLEKAQTCMPQALPGIADSLYAYCIADERWPADEALRKLMGFVFEFSDSADKGAIVRKYLDKQYAFGVDACAGCAEYARQAVEKAPFLWVNFIDYIYEGDNFKAYMTEHMESFNEMYLLFVSLVDAVPQLTDSQKETAQMYFMHLMAQTIRQESTDRFDALLAAIQKLGEQWEAWLVKNALAYLMRDGAKLTQVCNDQFILKLVVQLSGQELALILLEQLATENAEDPMFLARYVEETGNMQEKFRHYEKHLARDSRFSRFLDNVEIQRFSLIDNPSQSNMQWYYDAFYVTGKDHGLFQQKLSQYLRNYQGAEVIHVCRNLYDSWFAELPDTHADVPDCLVVLSEAVFRVEMSALIAYAMKNGTGAYTPILRRLHTAGYRMPVGYFALKLGLETRAAAEQQGARRSGTAINEAAELLRSGNFYCSILYGPEVDLFTGHFLADVVNLYLAVVTRDDFEVMLERCFEPLSHSRFFPTRMTAALEQLDRKGYPVLITDLFSYAYGQNGVFAEDLRRLIRGYLDEMPKSKRKKIFSTVLEKVLPDYRPRVKRFIERYQKEHESFFDKLFGGVKQPKEENPAEKTERAKQKK